MNKNMKSGGTSRRGFASMDPARVKEIASKGGVAAHEKGTAHEFTTEEARIAGKKGGLSTLGRSRRQADDYSDLNDVE